MKIRDLVEGGWSSKVTQGTVIHPSVVKSVLSIADRFAQEFNQFLQKKNMPGIRIGAPTGSSAYHDVDPEEKIYGDVDLQIIVPVVPETQGMTMNQMQGFWYRLEDAFVKSQKPGYVHPESKPGHPIFAVGPDAWVQVDLMPHHEHLAKWGRYRVTPERGTKGLLYGNMFSVLGELLDLSIQHSGVQAKVQGDARVPYAPTRKDYELKTITTDIERFVLDIFQDEAQHQGITKPKIDPLLSKYPGANIKDIRISDLVNAVKGIARSFEINGMYGKGNLAKYTDAKDFVNRFKDLYAAKAKKDIQASKREKAESPEARAHAEEDKRRIAQGLDMVMDLFQ